MNIKKVKESLDTIIERIDLARYEAFNRGLPSIERDLESSLKELKDIKKEIEYGLRNNKDN